jgi:hypothetical protein
MHEERMSSNHGAGGLHSCEMAFRHKSYRYFPDRRGSSKLQNVLSSSSYNRQPGSPSRVDVFEGGPTVLTQSSILHGNNSDERPFPPLPTSGIMNICRQDDDFSCTSVLGRRRAIIQGPRECFWYTSTPVKL